MSFYGIEATIEKLGITEQELKLMVRDGKLREFRDGNKLCFKDTEVDAIVNSNPVIRIVDALTQHLPDDKLHITHVEFWGKNERNEGGFVVHWEKKGVGVGEMTFCRKTGGLHCDTESMSKQFVEEVLDAFFESLIIDS